MRKRISFIAIISSIVFTVIITFVKCKNPNPLPGWTFLQTPVADSKIVGKLKIGESFTGDPCMDVDSLKSWNSINNNKGFGDSANISSNISRILNASIGFSDINSESISIDSVVVYQARDYSQCALPSKGSVVVSSAVAVTKFTVNTNNSSEAQIAANDIKKKYANVSISQHNNLVEARTGTGLVVAIKCIEITDMTVLDQDIDWKLGQANALDTFYRKENSFAFGSIDQNDSSFFSDSTKPKLFLKMTFSSGEFNEAGGYPKKGTVLYSATKKDLDSTGLQLHTLIQDQRYDCKLPTRILGATGTNEIMIYEVIIKNALISVDGFNPVAIPLTSFSDNFRGYYSVDNSSGHFTLRCKQWKFKAS